MRVLSFLVLLTATTVASGVAAAPQRWIKAVAVGEFSVDQPVGWTPAIGPPERLDLLSIPCRPNGAVLCDGQAEISVRSEPGAAKPTRTTACWNLVQTLSESEASPGRRVETTQLSCAIGPRRFTIVERHWKGDKHTASYGRIAMRMAKSLRYPAKVATKPLFHLP